MPNYNRVILAGNLTRDIELRYTPKGIAVGGSSLAINRKWKGEDGEQREEVTFVEFTVFGRIAEVMSEHLQKGSPVLVEGRLKLDMWEDERTREKRSKLKVIAESFQFIGSSNGGDGGREQQRSSRERPARSPMVDDQSGADDLPPEEDDVPF